MERRTRSGTIASFAIAAVLGFGITSALGDDGHGVDLGKAPDAPAAKVASECTTRAPDSARSAKALTNGPAIVTVRHGALRGLNNSGALVAEVPATGGEVLAHPATSMTRSVAVVSRTAARSELLVYSPDGARRVVPSNAPSHPAWLSDGRLAWVEDGTAIAVEGGPRFGKPDGSVVLATIASGTPGTVVAVVEHRGAGPEEAANLSNLWELDLGSGTWAQLTSFTQPKGGWVAVRTPVVEEDGTVLFVRIAGQDQATDGLPDNELWRLDPTTRQANKVQVLGKDVFLAGEVGGRMLYNRLDEASSEWLVTEQTRGGFRTIGCGAVMTDPVERVDVQVDPQLDTSFSPSSKGSRPAIAFVDFATQSEAEALMRRLDNTLDWEVATHDKQPVAVAPGRFIVIAPINVQSRDDVRNPIAALKQEFPEHSAKVVLTTYLDDA